MLEGIHLSRYDAIHIFKGVLYPWTLFLKTVYLTKYPVDLIKNVPRTLQISVYFSRAYGFEVTVNNV